MDFPVANLGPALSLLTIKFNKLNERWHHGSISIKHVSCHVLGTEGDGYTAWSWLPHTYQHKTPFPRTTTKSTQPLATHHCGQKHSAESTGIIGSGHSINMERMTKSQATWRKGGLEIQTMEMSLISLIPSTGVLLCQLRAMHLMKHHKAKPIPNTITFHFLHNSESQSDKLTSSWFRKSSLMHPQNSISFPITPMSARSKKKNEIDSQHTCKRASQRFTLKAFWIQVKWMAQLPCQRW